MGGTRGSSDGSVGWPAGDVRGSGAVNDERALAARALRLASGNADGLGPVDWPALFATARRERLAPLAWIRSSARILADADPGTAAAWRREWLGASVRAFRLLAFAGEMNAVLEAAGHRAVVLKGGALAHRLYGDASARPSTDLDLFVPESAREAALRAAEELGWRRAVADESGDALFSRPSADGEMFLEMHASLLGERLAFLPVPAPTSVRVEVDGVRVHAHDGPLLPAYLAAHLATHSLPPLLWWLDWWTLWRATDASGRQAARRAADDAGLGRYLAWAERRATAIGRAVARDDGALAAVGVTRRGRRDVHQLARHVALAPHPRAAAAAIREWVRPRWAPEQDGGPVLGTLRRIARHWRLLLPSGGDALAAASQPGMTRTKDAADVIMVAREVVAAGGEMWLGVTGRSMTPTIAEGDSVLLTRVDGRVREGDVVLAAGPPGPVLHRVRAASAVAVVTQGDACVTPDHGVPHASVVARAVAVRRGEVVAALTPTLRFGVAPLVRYLVRTARRPRRRAQIGAAPRPEHS